MPAESSGTIYRLNIRRCFRERIRERVISVDRSVGRASDMSDAKRCRNDARRGLERVLSAPAVRWTVQSFLEPAGFLAVRAAVRTLAQLWQLTGDKLTSNDHDGFWVMEFDKLRVVLRKTRTAEKMARILLEQRTEAPLYIYYRLAWSGEFTLMQLHWGCVMQAALGGPFSMECTQSGPWYQQYWSCVTNAEVAAAAPEGAEPDAARNAASSRDAGGVIGPGFRLMNQWATTVTRMSWLGRTPLAEIRFPETLVHFEMGLRPDTRLGDLVLPTGLRTLILRRTWEESGNERFDPANAEMGTVAVPAGLEELRLVDIPCSGRLLASWRALRMSALRRLHIVRWGWAWSSQPDGCVIDGATLPTRLRELHLNASGHPALFGKHAPFGFQLGRALPNSIELIHLYPADRVLHGGLLPAVLLEPRGLRRLIVDMHVCVAMTRAFTRGLEEFCECGTDPNTVLIDYPDRRNTLLEFRRAGLLLRRLQWTGCASFAGTERGMLARLEHLAIGGWLTDYDGAPTEWPRMPSLRAAWLGAVRRRSLQFVCREAPRLETLCAVFRNKDVLAPGDAVTLPSGLVELRLDGFETGDVALTWPATLRRMVLIAARTHDSAWLAGPGALPPALEYLVLYETQPNATRAPIPIGHWPLRTLASLAVTRGLLGALRTDTEPRDAGPAPYSRVAVLMKRCDEKERLRFQPYLLPGLREVLFANMWVSAAAPMTDAWLGDIWAAPRRATIDPSTGVIDWPLGV